MNYEVINHNSVRIDDIYFDPYGLKEQPLKAKYIFITHPHLYFCYKPELFQYQNLQNGVFHLAKHIFFC